MTSTDRHYQMDTARMIDLDLGWRAVICLDAEGNETLWLASPTPDLQAGCACSGCAPHELPEESAQPGHTASPATTATTTKDPA